MDLLLHVVTVLFVVIMEHKNMVQNTNFIKSKNGKIIQLKQNLNCTNFDIQYMLLLVIYALKFILAKL